MQPELGSNIADLTDVVVLDVRVVAWRNTGPGTVAALQEVFGLDVDTAQQLVSNLPAVVKRGVSASEAQAFMAALESVGAQVVIARSSGPITLDVARPGAPQTSASQRRPVASIEELRRPPPAAPPPRSIAQRPSQMLAGPAPSPPYALPDQARVMSSGPLPPPPRSLPNPPRATAKTLAGSTFAPHRPSGVVQAPQQQRGSASGTALDLLGNDGSSAMPRSGGAKRRGSGRLDSAPLFPDGADAPRLRREGQRELDLAPQDEPQRLDVEATRSSAGHRLPAPQELAMPARLELEPPTPRARAATDSGAIEPRRQGVVSPGATDAARAVTAVDPNAPRRPSRLVAMRHVLIALTIGAIGLWVDDSILRGDASPLGVLLHGFGIYQLGLGIRGLVS